MLWIKAGRGEIYYYSKSHPSPFFITLFWFLNTRQSLVISCIKSEKKHPLWNEKNWKKYSSNGHGCLVKRGKNLSWNFFFFLNFPKTEISRLYNGCLPHFFMRPQGRQSLLDNFSPPLPRDGNFWVLVKVKSSVNKLLWLLIVC